VSHTCQTVLRSSQRINHACRIPCGAKSPFSPSWPASSSIARLTLLKNLIRLDIDRFLYTSYSTVVRSTAQTDAHQRSQIANIVQFASYKNTTSATKHYLNMANIYINNSSSAFGIPEQAKLDFWVSNAHLTEDQRQEAWSNAALYQNNVFDISAQPSMAHQIPRTMPNSMSNLTQLPVWTSYLVVALPMF
jgi:hypothetical protein